MHQDKLLPCPFCGETPVLEYVAGTFYEFDCDCGIAGISLQISDLMTRAERVSATLKNYKYDTKYVERAKLHVVKLWNTRV